MSTSLEERRAELRTSLADIRARVDAATASSSCLTSNPRRPLLVAVSKYKPPSDILYCYEDSQQLDFGENYVQELVDKAKQLPQEIRWHFIGTLQSNKAKTLAAIPNLHTIETLTSTKAALGLEKALADQEGRTLNVLLQVNTSGEDAKSGLPSLPTDASAFNTNANMEELSLLALARLVLTQCPHLRLQGLMTIGALDQSLAASTGEENADFRCLLDTRDRLQTALRTAFPDAKYGDDSGRLVVSMGMSNDFEAALRVGSDIVRVGTGIFGSRPLKGEAQRHVA
ncbi:alanine racemase family protein [Fistulina hepatica ATCC 64428]|nr:alanine racemase family protein [Fistulina hepatica ATCC 64428]